MPMKKVSVTYVAPAGDAKVTEMFGHTLHDGHAEEIEVTERELEKLKGNRHFKIGKETDVDDDKADPKAEKAEREAAEQEDQRKKDAQGYSPPLRGAQANPQPTDKEKEELQEQPDKSRGTSGGAPDPSQSQTHKEAPGKSHGVQGSGANLGRDK